VRHFVIVGAFFGAFLVIETACNKPDENQISASSKTPAADVLGKNIEFKAGGGSENYRISGWSKTETEFTWTEGLAAKLGLPIPKGGSALTLRVTMSALIHPPELVAQPVEVYANGQKLDEWQVGGTAEFMTTVPASIRKAAETLVLEFRTPKATSPKALGVNEDPRVLGICVHSLKLTET
jgi:hypothetical protein